MMAPTAEFIKLLLKADADVNITNKDGTTPLLCSIQINNTNKVKLVIKAGADVNKAAINCTSSMLIAFKVSQERMIQQLFLRAGPDINILDIRGGTPLHYAVFK